MSFPPRKVCCDPLKRHRVAPKRGLRLVTFAIMAEYPSLGLTRHQYICTDCRKELKTNHEQLQAASSSRDSEDEVLSTCTSTRTPTPPALDINDDQACHLTDDEASDSSSAGPSSAQKTQTDPIVSANDGDEMMQQLKEKYNSSTSRSERMRILTLLPRSWSIKKAANVFGVSKYLIRQAKKLVAEKGIMSSPNPKCGRTLPAHIEEEIKHFYLSDEISRVMPGKKDFISVVQVQGGKRVHQQKRLLLCNLREAYREFKQRHPDLKIGFTKFAMLRPRECVLAGASGTHSVCVCVLHQNVKLMMLGAKLESLTDGELKHYRDCFAAMMCNPPNIKCFFGTCDRCPGTEPLHALLQAAADEHGIDTIEFKQWTTTDRATMETKVLPVEDFIDCFMGMLKKLSLHDYTAKMQSSFMQQTKESLKPGEFLVLADFSENYSFVIQDEVQSFHWNNSSATVHPFVCYYMEAGKLNSLCFIVISESTVHDTVAVHLFQGKLVTFLTQKFGGVKPRKIFYYSDGCAAQYKNCKNFTNLCYHVEDFGVQAEWHFFATSHGKSAGDGAGGTLKRLASRASLQRLYSNHILTAKQLYDFAVSEVKGMHFGFATLTEHEQEAKLLEDRLKRSRTVPGTQKVHSVIPVSSTAVEVKPFSSSTVSRIERVSLDHQTVAALPTSAIGGYVTVAYDGCCWIGCVLSINSQDRNITVKFLHPHIPATSFFYPQHEDILEVDPLDILTIVHPITATGRTYNLTRNEMQEATSALESYLSCM